MKKAFKYYFAVWTVILVLFNVIAFVTPGVEGVSKYTASFWIGYVFITLAFIGQLACAYMAFKEENLSKFFYSIPVVSVSYTGLILSILVGGLCMLIPALPYWIGIIACAIVLCFTAVAVGKAIASSDIVSDIDDKIKVQTFFIKSLTVDTDSLITHAKSEAIKAECRKVYEAARYSDPMSNDALASLESEITIKFAKLSEAVASDDAASVADLANEVVILIGDRNKKCKLLK